MWSFTLLIMTSFDDVKEDPVLILLLTVSDCHKSCLPERETDMAKEHCESVWVPEMEKSVFWVQKKPIVTQKPHKN